MKNGLSKRIIAVVMSLILCISVAAISSAVEGSATQSRTITLDTSKVIQSDYKGIGDNLWVGPYSFNMNDAYQKVNEARTNKVQAAWLRMLLEPSIMVFLDEEPAVQQERWEAGIYNTDCVDYKDFINKAKMVAQAGTVIQLNMGGRVDTMHGMATWFSIKDSSTSEGGTRGAPANLEAWAKATAFMVREMVELTDTYGKEGLNKINGKPVIYLSFYNEINGFSYEAFGNKLEHYCLMIKMVHEELIDAGLREYVEISGTDLTGFSTSLGVMQALRYMTDNLKDENGDPIYDYLSTHHYDATRSAKTMLERCKNYFPLLETTPEKLDLCITEAAPSSHPNGGEQRVQNFGCNEVSRAITNMNSGLSGYGSWFFHQEFLANPISMSIGGVGASLWGTPAASLDNVTHDLGIKGLLMRYTYKHGAVYETEVSADDIRTSYITSKDGNDHTIIIDSDKSDATRNLTINVDSNIPDGTVFERHIFDFTESFPTDDQGWETLKTSDSAKWIYNTVDSLGNTQGSANAIIPPTDKYVTVQNGKIEDILPNNHVGIIYTTTKQIVQIELKDLELEVASGASAAFELKKVYGTNNQKVTFEVMGKNDYVNFGNGNNAGVALNDHGYGWTTQNAGTITADGVYTAIGTNSGDTVAIKVIPEADPDAYSVAIVKII